MELARLRHHGDVDAEPGLIDFATNIAVDRPPPWLRTALIDSLDRLACYPSPAADLAARRVVADRHGRHPDEVLILAGVAEGFSLLPRLTPSVAAVIHPSFTEPELMLRQAGIPVRRVLLPPGEAFTDTRLGGFLLDPGDVPEDADLVVLGNPTNPTSITHPAATILRLARPGRVIVVDEAFMDAVPGEAQSLADRRAPDMIVFRSLTKTFGLAGLRVGYALASPELLARLSTGRPNWPVSTPALAAVQACGTPRALSWAVERAGRIAEHRNWMIDHLPVPTAAPATAPFLLLRVPHGPAALTWLRANGIAARRCTFPGLTDDDIRVAVRPPDTAKPLIDALTEYLSRVRSTRHTVKGQTWQPSKT